MKRGEIRSVLCGFVMLYVWQFCSVSGKYLLERKCCVEGMPARSDTCSCWGHCYGSNVLIAFSLYYIHRINPLGIHLQISSLFVPEVFNTPFFVLGFLWKERKNVKLPSLLCGVHTPPLPTLSFAASFPTPVHQKQDAVALRNRISYAMQWLIHGNTP